jgi:hypothetical protein
MNMNTSPCRCIYLLLLISIFSLDLTKISAQGKPDTSLQSPRRTILLVIDGLANGAIERLPLKHLEELKSEGVYFSNLVLPLAAHPKQNTNANDPKFYPWSCSIPNPVMMTGTVFIGQSGIKETLLQHTCNKAGIKTAFIVNSDAYTEIAGGYDIYRQEWKSDDDSPVFPALQDVIKTEDPSFIRVHLQSSGAGGYIDQRNNRRIWDTNSEYRRRALKVDSLIGNFITWLKSNNYWNETVVFISGDHGQADVGGHAPYELNGDKTSLLIAGKGIKKAKRFDYAEMIDIAPTIAYLQGIPAPRYSQGRVLKSAFVTHPDDLAQPHTQLELNEVMRQQHELSNEGLRPGSRQINESFLRIEEIGSWHTRFTNLEKLLEHQKKTLKALKNTPD